jgi:hypothetical protein
MSPLVIAVIVLACVFCSAMLGLLIAGALPDPHLSADTKDTVRVATALVATLAALVLSLLISSAKSSFDRMGNELLENAARTTELDRALADYGPEAKEAREILKRAYAARIDLLFPRDAPRLENEDTPESILRTENLRAKLAQLSPRNDVQRGLQSEALQLTEQIAATRWLLLLQKDEPIPMTLLTVLVLWLGIIFSTVGLFAPRNATVVAAVFVCALSVSGAILLILEMNTPFSGLITISSAPMRDTLANLGR